MSSIVTPNAPADRETAKPAESTSGAGPRPRWMDRLTSSRFRRLGREMLFIGLGQAAAVLGALFGVRLLTGLLSPDVYGELALGMTVATLIGGTLFGPLGSGATRFFAPAREAGALCSYFAAVRGLVIRATGGVLLIALITCLGLAATGHSRWLGLGLAALCFALFSGYNSVLNGMQNAARQRAVVALHQGLASWGRFLLAVGLVVWLGASSTIAMLGYALAIFVVLASQSWFFRRTLAPGRDGFDAAQPAQGQWRADMFAYAWPFATWGVLTWTQVASQRWALQLFSSTGDVGYYAVLYQLGYYPITIVTTLMVQLISPVLFQRAGDGCDKVRMAHVYALNWRLVYVAGGLTAMAFFPVLWLHDRVFAVLVAPEYASVSHLLPWMLLAGGLFATGQAASLSLMSSLESKRLLAPKIVTAVIGIIGSYLGAALFGTAGVVGGGVLFGVVYLIWIFAITVGQHRQFVRSRDTEAETALA